MSRKMLRATGVLFMVTALIACGGDEEVDSDTAVESEAPELADWVAAFTDVNDILDGVTDKSSARVAKSRLELLLEGRLSTLGEQRDESGEEADEGETTLEWLGVQNRFMTHIGRITADAELSEVLGETVDSLMTFLQSGG